MTNSHSGPLLAERDGIKIYACQSCGFAHVIPLPDASAQDEYYKTSFWEQKGRGWLQIYEAQRDWQTMRDGDWLSCLEAHTPGRKLLDVGSGYGFFLKSARLRSWRVMGIEPSVQANKYATEKFLLTVHQGTWENFDHPALRPFKFDAITAFWLIEHLPDPARFLLWCRAHLYGGGTLVLALPQEWTAEMDVANEVAAVHNWHIHPTHSNYFTAATLYGLLGRCGFRVVDALATYPMADWITKAGVDYTEDEKLGADCHARVRITELGQTQAERLSVGRVRARQAAGRDLVLYAVPEG